MRSGFIAVLAVLALLSPLMTAGARAADDQAIKAKLEEFKAAWDKDDAAGLAAVMTDDATLINPGGVVAKGHDEIVKLLEHEHATMFKATTYTIKDVTVQQVTDDVVVADVSATITGMHKPDGSAAPDFDHHVAWVFVKKDGKWLGAAARPYQLLHKPAAAMKADK